MTPLRFTHQDRQIELAVEPDGDGWRVHLPDGSETWIAARLMAGDVLEITEGARTFRVPVARTERGVEITFEGETYSFQPVTGRVGKPKRERGVGALTAPMAGIMADMLVTVGQRVEAYQPLATVEAMKVYATVEAPRAGVVTAVHVQKGERVAQGAPVVDMTPVTGEGSAA